MARGVRVDKEEGGLPLASAVHLLDPGGRAVVLLLARELVGRGRSGLWELAPEIQA